MTSRLEEQLMHQTGRSEGALALIPQQALRQPLQLVVIAIGVTPILERFNGVCLQFTHKTLTAH